MEAEDFDEAFLSIEADFESEPVGHRASRDSRSQGSRHLSQRPSHTESRVFVRDLTNSLRPNASDNGGSFLLAIVIAKQEPRNFLGKDGTERWRLSFTVRDSPIEWINVTCWGEERWIMKTSQAFTIGDAVKIQGARCSKVDDVETRERYAPSCPHPHVLSVSDPTGGVSRYVGRELSSLLCLLQMPVHNSICSISLGVASEAEPGRRVNLLVGVKSLTGPRVVQTKFGRRTTASLRVMDDTCRDFTVKTWNKEEVQLFQKWQPRSIVHLQDVKLIRDEFLDRVIAQTDVKTLAQYSPETAAARRLRDFMRDADIGSGDMGAGKDVDLDSVDRVLQVEDVYKIMEEMARTTTDTPVPSHFFIYGILTSFPVDSVDETAFLLRRCIACRKRVRHLEQNACDACIRQNDGSRWSNSNEVEFGVSCDVSDHSGTLTRVWIPNTVVKEMLQGMTPGEFLRVDEDVKTRIKWQHLLVASKMAFKMERSRTKTPMLQLLRWRIAETNEDQLDALVNWE